MMPTEENLFKTESLKSRGTVCYEKIKIYFTETPHCSALALLKHQ